MNVHTETPDGIKLLQGDVRECLRALPEKSVNVCVTSPPYFGLRAYAGSVPTIWEPPYADGSECEHEFTVEGGEPPVHRAGNKPGKPSGISQKRRAAASGDLSQWNNCEHEWGEEGKPFHPGQVPDGKWSQTAEQIPGQKVSSGGLNSTSIGNGKGQATNRGSLFVASGGRFCAKCGAWLGSYGNEPSVSLYVWHTVLICREIRRVLRDDAVMLWNVGDSFAGNGGVGGQGQNGGFGGSHKLNNQKARAQDPTFQQKQLLMVPARVAIALQEDGWWLRQDIIWEKASPMPESVLDRPTTAHEHIFLLAKRPDYYYDALAVREPGDPDQTEHNRKYAREYYRSLEALDGGVPEAQNNKGMHARPGVGGHNLRSVWTLSSEPQSDALCRSCGAYYKGSAWARLKTRKKDGIPQRVCKCGAVDWVSHFAAFPSEIPKRAILAGTSEQGVCGECGAPYRRLTARVDAACVNPRHFSKTGQEDRQDSDRVYTETLVRTLGWTPTCKCDSEIVPAVVLDPFVGSGTTLLVARGLGRRGIGIDLSGDYLSLAAHRLQEVPLSLLNDYREPEQPESVQFEQERLL